MDDELLDWLEFALGFGWSALLALWDGDEEW